ncbi:hypothetical protein LCGC14_1362640 [marine sediment metagenome]|uniref:Uncharacterized protein n=1 Tax=marine sediment metagenome TaxID=412755 RepID=A0A0F9MMX4_9ZZZZ
MSRPKPKILFEFVDKEYKAEQVLKASAIFAVCYDEQPINLRTLNVMIEYPGPKYKKCSFSNPGHAFNLAERLNKIFKTNKFAVHKMVMGPIVKEDEL